MLTCGIGYFRRLQLKVSVKLWSQVNSVSSVKFWGHNSSSFLKPRKSLHFLQSLVLSEFRTTGANKSIFQRLFSSIIDCAITINLAPTLFHYKIQLFIATFSTHNHKTTGSNKNSLHSLLFILKNMWYPLTMHLSATVSTCLWLPAPRTRTPRAPGCTCMRTTSWPPSDNSH